MFGRLNRPLLLLLALASTGTLATQAAETSGRPLNVILILADDLGWADLGCYGADLHETPALDRFATKAVRFTQAYAASVCSPTRASLMTGKHYARLGITTYREAATTPPRDQKLVPPVAAADLAHEEITLGEKFSAAGYLTALVGKWHLGAATHYPETQGFDINIGGTLWGAPFSYFFPYRGAGRYGGEIRYVPQLHGGKPEEYLTDRLTDEALKMIDSAGDRPFFLYLAHHAPHTPIEARPDKLAHFEQKLRPGLRHTNPGFAAMVASLDQSVGRVLARLEERKLAEQTVVVFVSDNGGHIGEFDDRQVTNNHPLRSGKGSLYEGGVRVPLLIRWPGVGIPGGICHEPVYAADLFPTLLEMTGVEPNAVDLNSSDSLSLAPLVRDPAAKLPREQLYFHFPHYYPSTKPVGAIRARDWKLIEYFEDGARELYNLGDDPSETTNLVESQADRAAELQAALACWRSSVGARMPVANANFKPAN